MYNILELCKQDGTAAITVRRDCYLIFICQGYDVPPKKKSTFNTSSTHYYGNCAKSIKSFYKVPRNRVAWAAGHSG